MPMRRKLEFVCLFFGLPVLLRLMPVVSKKTGINLTIPIIPVLVVIAGFVLICLRRTTSFKTPDLVRVSTATRRNWIFMLARFTIIAFLLAVVLALYKPEGLLKFPRERTGIWLLVMCFYPLASVMPQGIVYRAFYNYRYAELFPMSLQTLIGATVFSFAHLPFANLYALSFTFIGGLMFLTSYKRSRSLLFSGIEHALYGNFLFTIGWGEYFFHAGTLRMLSQH